MCWLRNAPGELEKLNACGDCQGTVAVDRWVEQAARCMTFMISHVEKRSVEIKGLVSQEGPPRKYEVLQSA